MKRHSVHRGPVASHTRKAGILERAELLAHEIHEKARKWAEAPRRWGRTPGRFSLKHTPALRATRPARTGGLGFRVLGLGFWLARGTRRCLRGLEVSVRSHRGAARSPLSSSRRDADLRVRRGDRRHPARESWKHTRFPRPRLRRALRRRGRDVIRRGRCRHARGCSRRRWRVPDHRSCPSITHAAAHRSGRRVRRGAGGDL